VGLNITTNKMRRVNVLEQGRAPIFDSRDSGYRI